MTMKQNLKILSIVLMLALIRGMTAAFASAAGEVAEEAPQQEEVVVNDAEISMELEAKMIAPQTFDFGLVAASAAVVSLAGFALARKKR